VLAAEESWEFGQGGVEIVTDMDDYQTYQSCYFQIMSQIIPWYSGPSRALMKFLAIIGLLPQSAIGSREDAILMGDDFVQLTRRKV